jgi:Fe2+ or Zn2+ uptake regulation protein
MAKRVKKTDPITKNVYYVDSNRVSHGVICAKCNASFEMSCCNAEAMAGSVCSECGGILQIYQMVRHT